jgi:hypothetical protein
MATHKARLMPPRRAKAINVGGGRMEAGGWRLEDFHREALLFSKRHVITRRSQPDEAMFDVSHFQSYTVLVTHVPVG